MRITSSGDITLTGPRKIPYYYKTAEINDNNEYPMAYLGWGFQELLLSANETCSGGGGCTSTVKIMNCGYNNKASWISPNGLTNCNTTNGDSWTSKSGNVYKLIISQFSTISITRTSGTTPYTLSVTQFDP